MTELREMLDREQECDRILKVCGPEQAAIFRVLDVQFRLLHNRAQVLLGICGVLLSTSVLLMTGKIIGQREFAHQHVIGKLLIAAGITEIAAAAIVVGGVLRLRWMTELPGDDVRGWLLTSLRYRDSKTHAYRASVLLVLLAMLFYQVAASFVWAQL